MKQHNVKKWVFVVAGLLGASQVSCPRTPIGSDAGERKTSEVGAPQPRRVVLVVTTVLFVRRAVGAGQSPFARRCGHTPVGASCASDIEDLGGEPRSCFSAARCGHTCSRALRRSMVPGNIRCGVTPPPLLSTASSGADFGSSLTGLRGAFLSPAEKAKVELRKLQARMNVNGAFQLKLIDKGSIDLIGAPIRRLVADVLSSGAASLTPAVIETSVAARQDAIAAMRERYGVLSEGQADAIGNADAFVVSLLQILEKLVPRV